MCITITQENNTLQQNSFDVIAHQLTRIADAMQPTGVQVTESDDTRPSAGHRADPSCRVPAMPESLTGAPSGSHDLHTRERGRRILGARGQCFAYAPRTTRMQRGDEVTMSWYTSDRQSRLPEDWDRVRAMVRDRAHNHCQAATHSVLCNGIGTDCDHIVPGDDHSLDNLQWLNHNCHRLKTARESAQRNMIRARERKHPREANPGRIC
ncbi:hypothetical protein D2E22_1678 [Bifidobacterium castoris]|uniref:HNH nuclease domain-containing protein n=2 Tax=Bifidobacterium castoris TaxID=2306972 RepID=A0A430F548_9BIFI|nr:hypothetical protein D2E22_1678 [Bifidobacterium castoris]